MINLKNLITELNMKIQAINITANCHKVVFYNFPSKRQNNDKIYEAKTRIISMINRKSPFWPAICTILKIMCV